MAKYHSKIDLAMGRRFDKICKNAFPGRSRADIAEEIGTSNGGRVRLFEQGSMPETDVLKRLDELGYSIEWLLMNRGAMRKSDVGGSDEVRESDSSAKRMINGKPYHPYPIPVYASAAADSHHAEEGARVVATDATPEGYFTLPDGCCGIRIHGDSMEPIARDGQIAILAPDTRSATNGDLVVVTLKHEKGTYFKRYHKTKRKGGFMVTLSSENITKAIPPIVVDEDDIVDLRVVIGIRFEADEWVAPEED